MCKETIRGETEARPGPRKPQKDANPDLNFEGYEELVKRTISILGWRERAREASIRSLRHGLKTMPMLVMNRVRFFMENTGINSVQLDATQCKVHKVEVCMILES